MQRVYLHYPFCLTLCRYCNFAAGAPPKEEFLSAYHDALFQEIEHYKQEWDFSQISQKSFYFGGGTPSLIPYEIFEKIFTMIPLHKESEITLEINPETVTYEKAKFWKDIGINRVSLGWQSMNPQTLTFLGRSGDTIDNRRSFDILREIGFDNISVDRILSVQNDTDHEFLSAIKECMPDHISTYQLTIEQKTVLYHWTQTKKYLPIPDERAVEIEIETENALNALGFDRYETSNYHRNNKKGQHNLGYWNYEHWLGIGAGASGFVPNDEYGNRYRNHFSFKDYIKNPLQKEETETITKDIAIQEALMLGIRKIDGINKKEFTQKFELSWSELFPTGISTEFFEEDSNTIRLKKSMIPFTNPAIISLWESIKKR